ncbi:hypothetical protein EJB05_37412, partial [Eragrostis curvula]
MSRLLRSLCLFLVTADGVVIGVLDGGNRDGEVEVLIDLKRFLQKNNKVTRGAYGAWPESDSSSPCGWRGVGCGADGRVTSLDLSGASISGPAFGNFSRLTELAWLDLSDNTLRGVGDINQCCGLVHLVNMMALDDPYGKRVTEYKETQLQSRENRRQGDAAPIKDRSQGDRNQGDAAPINGFTLLCLTHLNLSRNLISGPLNMSGLTRLRTIDVSGNRLQGDITANFPAICADLTVLNVSTNMLTGNITGLFDGCGKLEFVDLSSNKFVGELWPGVAKFRLLSVAKNMLTGSIPPATFPEGCKLESLGLSANQLVRKFPDSISKCSNLTYLSLWENGFTGAIPVGMGELTVLHTLILGKNMFDPQIPLRLTNCTKLQFLDLSSNMFGGDVQDIFGRLASLRHLMLHHNNYSGGLVASGVLQLPLLTRLDLSFNEFTGELPAMVADMKRLQYLMLACNKFSGGIPPTYGRLAELQALDLSYNKLTGAIPVSIGNLTSLLWLMLAGNQLSGEIPPEIGNCTSLLWLNIAGNKLTGKIPPEMASIGRDPAPTFAKNRNDPSVFAGSGECQAMKRWIPASYPPFSFVYSIMTWENCRSIWDRILKGYGVAPIRTNYSSPMRSETTSGYVQLSGNQLSGEIPPQMGEMRNLSLLLLDDNRLTGRLPPDIGQLPLLVLNVSRNNISGTIPLEICSMLSLEMMDLSYNNFSGELPGSLIQLTELNSFNVSYNPLLSGTFRTTGQFGTFDEQSFLGDPLISLRRDASKQPPPAASDAVISSGMSRRTIMMRFLSGFIIVASLLLPPVGFIAYFAFKVPHLRDQPACPVSRRP